MSTQIQTREAFEPVKTAASLLGVPASWLKSEAKAGRLPCLQVGRRMLLNVEQTRQALLEKAEVAK